MSEFLGEIYFDLYCEYSLSTDYVIGISVA